MTSRKPNENDASLPFAALQLLAPPVRLVSAALWKVLKQKDVMQYGVVEEFVTSACENVPGLLTLRHRGKLTLGLRARLIIELCRTQPDAEVIAPHLERIRVPAAPSSSHSSAVKTDVKLAKTVESFQSFIHVLLTSPAERERFFKETFVVDYGPEFDQGLEKLLWEFLIRLDQLLPVPNLSQTVAWLSKAPPVLEECAQAATQPQLLKILLQHQTCLGHLESAASLPPNLGDSVLASLSLPPSGRVQSNPPTGSNQSSNELSNGPQPATGLISHENAPLRISDRKQTLDKTTSEHLDPNKDSKFTLVKQKPDPKEDGAKMSEEEGEMSVFNQSGGVKRKLVQDMENESEEELLVSTSGETRTKRQQGVNESEEEEAESLKRDGWNSELMAAGATRHGIGNLRLPEDPLVRSVIASCLSKQPTVTLEKLSFDSFSTSGSGEKFFRKKQPKGRKKSSTRKQMTVCPGLDDKENQPALSASSPSSLQRSNAETAALRGDGDDSYVADSEDEATKNFKGRLFIKRYCKTKHGTYIPTLREFWRPSLTRRSLFSTSSKPR